MQHPAARLAILAFLVLPGCGGCRVYRYGFGHPRMRVHRSGLPFDDPSGDRLRDWMGLDRAAFYDRSRVAIVPMAFCFPGYDARGSDLPPPRRCAETWREALLARLARVELTLVIGQYAQRWHMPEARGRKVSDVVADWRAGLPRVVPLPHPSWRNTAWLKKNPWFEADLVPELRRRIARLAGSGG